MLVIFGALLGVGWGYFLAHKKKGTRLDKLHYSVSFAIAFGLLSWILTLIIGWYWI